MPHRNSVLHSDVPVELLEKAVTSSPYGYVITSCGQNGCSIIFVNQAFHSITGYTAQEVLGRNCRFLLGKDTRQSSLEQIHDAMKNSRQCIAVVRNYKKDGCLFYNELSLVPISDQSGKLTHCLWMQKDITTQIENAEEMEALIAEKEERFSAYMENSNEALWQIEFSPPISLDGQEALKVREVFHNGIFKEANDVVAATYGLQEGREVIGRPLADFMKDSESDNVATILKLVRNDFFMDNIMSKETSSNGESKMILNNIKPFIRNGEVRSIWGASLDVSSLFQVQENLKNSKKKLKSQKRKLEKKNIALRELIIQIELDKKEFQDRILANIQQLVLPSLDKIMLNDRNGEYIEQLRMNLKNLTSTFGQKMSDPRMRLSPREIEVCNYVKNGLSNKEISRLLNIAIHTVEKHRRMARKKMSLTNKGVNLNTYLNSL